MSRRPTAPRVRASAGAVPGARSTAGARSAARAPTRSARSASGTRAPAQPARSPRGPTASRPTEPTRSGGERPSVPEPRRRSRLISVRALVLGVVTLIGFSLVFPTVQAWLGQRAELESLATQVTEAEQTERDLRAELDRWDDPAYVQAQARERLSYVMPGETSYRVIDPEVVVEQEAELAPGPAAGPAVPPDAGVAPWYTMVWESVEVAGGAEVVGPGVDADPASTTEESGPTVGDQP